MSVDVCLYGLIGIKGEYNDFVFLKNKNDDSRDNLDEYKNIVYLDYLPSGYITVSDGMCGVYSGIGKKLLLEDELFDGFELSISPNMLDDIKQEVIRDFKDLKLNFKEEDIKLHIFTHFS